jgi:parallel beta-helix repeat protein
MIKNILKSPGRLAVVLVMLALAAIPAAPTQAYGAVFVEPTGDGDCSQDNPCSLQYALTNAELGDAIYAAAGTYTGTGNEVALIDLPLYFHGGWNGAPTGPFVTDPDLYVSILDGQNARRALTINIDPSLVEQTVVDGWTILNGNATALTDYCEVWAFAGGGCGGGIYINANDVLIVNNIIHSNTAANSESELGGGGGIYVVESSDVTVFGNQIHDNNSNTWGEGWGGGIYFHMSGGGSALTENEIYNNDLVADADDYHHGSGIMLVFITETVEINDNFIHDNSLDEAKFYGTGIGCQYCTAEAVIQGNQIINNNGSSALSLGYSSPLIQQNTIINPEAESGIFFGPKYPGENINIYNNIIAGHELYNLRATLYAGESTTVIMMHNTLADAPFGLSIYSIGTGTLIFSNSIVSGHSDTGVVQTGDMALILAMNNVLFHANHLDGITGANPLTGDPNFKSPISYNYHLDRGSQAIDRLASGLSFDIDGDTRPFGSGETRFDVGADEFIHSAFFFLPLSVK